MIIFCSKGLSPWLIVSPVIRDYSNEIQCVVEFPVIPKKPNGTKSTGLISKIRSSSIHYLWFNVVTIKVFQIISSVFGNSIQKLCVRKRVSYRKVEFIDDAFLKWVEKQKPNYIINVSGNILRDNLLQIAKHGVLNYHCARLPEFRGAANYFWHLIENESSACGTLHYVTPELDNGEIIKFSEEIHIIPKQTTVFNLWLSIRKQFEVLLAECISVIKMGGKLSSTPQDDTKATLRSFPTANEVKKLFTNGFRVFSLADYVKVIRIAITGRF
ncbi:MAG: hypothetical protein KDC92_05185 [Bacteroidetes bacterium]|nr:hypothetical protein [Bacteroidota bacterium]